MSFYYGDRDAAPGRQVLDRPVRWPTRLPLILLLPIGALLQWAAARLPALVEIYTGSLFPLIARLQGALTGWIPFSVAESVALLLLLLLLGALIRRVREVRRGGRRWRNVGLHAAVDLLALAGLIYGGGVLLWGLNYHRTPFVESARWDGSPPTTEELKSLCTMLIERTNRARLEVEEDDDGAMRFRGSRRDALQRAWRGFHRARQLYPPLEKGYAGAAKGLALLSTPMSYLGLGGVFSMYTGEPNVNVKQPDSQVAASACHEIAHQMGFAREQEASFVGYLACTHHPDADFRYAGYVDAMRSASRALWRADRQAHEATFRALTPAVRRDLTAIKEFWRRYESRLTELSYRMNDLYLKSQGQSEGIASYGMMVDLLVAELRAAGGLLARPGERGRPR